MVAGQVADRSSRQQPLRFGMLAGVVAIASLWFAMYGGYSKQSDSHEYWMATAGLATWGIFRGVTMAPLDALYADSIATTERAKLQVWKFVATLIGAAAGPTLAAVMFHVVGDTYVCFDRSDSDSVLCDKVWKVFLKDNLVISIIN
jgi:MFS family permease